MDEKEILEMIGRYCVIEQNRRYLTCVTAFKIAKELNLDVSIIGQICNREKIKIRDCKIGCF